MSDKKFVFLHKFNSYKEENDQKMKNLDSKQSGDYKFLLFLILISMVLGIIGIFT